MPTITFKSDATTVVGTITYLATYPQPTTDESGSIKLDVWNGVAVATVRFRPSQGSGTTFTWRGVTLHSSYSHIDTTAPNLVGVTSSLSPTRQLVLASVGTELLSAGSMTALNVLVTPASSSTIMAAGGDLSIPANKHVLSGICFSSKSATGLPAIFDTHNNFVTAGEIDNLKATIGGVDFAVATCFNPHNTAIYLYNATPALLAALPATITFQIKGVDYVGSKNGSLSFSVTQRYNLIAIPSLAAVQTSPIIIGIAGTDGFYGDGEILVSTTVTVPEVRTNIVIPTPVISGSTVKWSSAILPNTLSGQLNFSYTMTDNAATPNVSQVFTQANLPGGAYTLRKWTTANVPILGANWSKHTGSPTWGIRSTGSDFTVDGNFARLGEQDVLLVIEGVAYQFALTVFSGNGFSAFDILATAAQVPSTPAGFGIFLNDVQAGNIITAKNESGGRRRFMIGTTSAWNTFDADRTDPINLRVTGTNVYLSIP